MISYNEILEAIKLRYGSLEEPHFGFVQEALDQMPYADLEALLRSKFEIIDETDPNDDVSFVYILSTPGNARQYWSLWLSMVGPYALLMRHRSGSFVEAIIANASDAERPEESFIVQACMRFGFVLLNRSLLNMPVPLKLFVTEPHNTKVFQALFSDQDLAPWEPLPK